MLTGADLHTFGGLATAADSAKVEASVGGIGQLQLQRRALTRDGNSHGVQAVDVEGDFLSVQAGLTGAEGDAHVLACTRG